MVRLEPLRILPADRPAYLGGTLRRPMLAGFVYLCAITAAELITALVHPLVGLLLHVLVFGALLIHGALLHQPLYRGFILALTIAPLIRIVSLTMPLGSVEPEWRFLVASVPLLAVGLVLMRTIPLSREQVHVRIDFSPKGLLMGLIVAVSGVPLGLVEFRILRPDPLLLSSHPLQILIASLILLVSTGFTEEFLFRGVLQSTATSLYGDAVGIALVSFTFGVLHIGHLSAIDVLFVTAVAVYFSMVVLRTRSIVPVSIAHGITNITLFIGAPLYF